MFAPYVSPRSAHTRHHNPSLAAIRRHRLVAEKSTQLPTMRDPPPEPRPLGMLRYTTPSMNPHVSLPPTPPFHFRSHPSCRPSHRCISVHTHVHPHLFFFLSFFVPFWLAEVPRKNLLGVVHTYIRMDGRTDGNPGCGNSPRVFGLVLTREARGGGGWEQKDRRSLGREKHMHILRKKKKLKKSRGKSKIAQTTKAVQ